MLFRPFWPQTTMVWCHVCFQLTTVAQNQPGHRIIPGSRKTDEIFNIQYFFQQQQQCNRSCTALKDLAQMREEALPANLAGVRRLMTLRCRVSHNIPTPASAVGSVPQNSEITTCIFSPICFSSTNQADLLNLDSSSCFASGMFFGLGMQLFFHASFSLWMSWSRLPETLPHNFCASFNLFCSKVECTYCRNVLCYTDSTSGPKCSPTKAKYPTHLNHMRMETGSRCPHLHKVKRVFGPESDVGPRDRE